MVTRLNTSTHTEFNRPTYIPYFTTDISIAMVTGITIPENISYMYFKKAFYYLYHSAKLYSKLHDYTYQTNEERVYISITMRKM